MGGVGRVIAAVLQTGQSFRNNEVASQLVKLDNGGKCYWIRGGVNGGGA